MKKNYLYALVMIAGLAVAQASVSTSLLDELIVKSGLWKQIGQLEAMVQAGVEQAQLQAKENKLKDAELTALKRAMRTAYAPDRMRADVRKVLTNELAEADQKQVMVWLDSATGKKMTRLEEQSGENTDLKKREQESSAYAAMLPKSRSERIVRFMQSMRAAEAMTSLIINNNLAIANGLAMTAPVRELISFEALTKQLESQRPQIVSAMEKRLLTEYAYIYRTVTDAEIEQYITFADTSVGRKYHAASIAAIEKAMVEASLVVGFEMGNIKKEKKT